MGKISGLIGSGAMRVALAKQEMTFSLFWKKRL
jgi:hypothetical protein